MTAQTLDRATVSDQELPKKKEYTVERARVPLVLKLFGLTALLIAAVVATAVGITLQRANRIAGETVNASITSAAKLFHELEEQRLKRLELPAALLGNDPSFAAAIENSLTGADPAVPAIDPAAPPIAAPDPAVAPVTPPAPAAI